MALDSLRNEITLLRNECASKKNELEKCKEESSTAMDENRSWNNKNQLLRKKIEDIKKVVKSNEEENRRLLAFKRELCDEIKKIQLDITAQMEMKESIFILEQQLRKELLNTEPANNDNTILKDCLINTKNQIEEKNSKLRPLDAEYQEATRKINILKQGIAKSTASLEQNTQDTDKTLEALKRNKELKGKNDKLEIDLNEALLLNINLQEEVSEKNEQVRLLKDTLETCEKNIGILETLSENDSTKISDLIAKLADVKTDLEETTDTRNHLRLTYEKLEVESKTLNLNLTNLRKFYSIAVEQLESTLDRNEQLRENLKLITSESENGETLKDLKVALLTCMVTTRKALDKLRRFPGASDMV